MKYQVAPPLTETEYEELKADIALRGIFVPIEYDSGGNVLDGHHRLKICEELGITNYPKVIRFNMSESEKLAHARKLNLLRRHLTPEQRRELVKSAIAESPETSNRQIAAELGIHNSTVSDIRRKMHEAGEIDTATGNEEQRGKIKKAIEANPEASNRQIAENLGASHHTVENVRKEKKQSERVGKMPESGILPTENKSLPWHPEQESTPENVIKPDNCGDEHAEEKAKPHVAQNSGNNEWYTPESIIEAARTVLGTIDLDPASCEFANRIVKAEKYYSIENDGLTQDWSGHVWLNPPYAGDLIPQFCDKLKEHIESKDVTEAIVLVNNATETAWFNTLVSIASAIIFPRSRIRYYMTDGTKSTPLQGQAIIYAGERPEMFYKTFCGFGWGAFFKNGFLRKNPSVIVRY